MVRSLIFVVFVLAFVSASLAFDLDENYLSRILDVCNFYNVSSVFVFFERTSGDLEYTRTLHWWIRELSRQNFFTAVMKISDLQIMSNYRGRVVRPLFVVLLSNNDSIVEFSNKTRNFDLTMAYWYVIFLPGDNLAEYCPVPSDNHFNVLFNTEMVVSCPQDRILREWYSIGKNRTKVFELAKWEPNGKLTFLTELDLHERRNNLEGLIVPVVIVVNDPFVKIDIDGNLAGICGRILMELSQDANVSFVMVKNVIAYGRYNKRRHSWTGAVGELVANRAEFAASYVSMSSSRLNAVDFTLPFILSSFSLYIKEPEVYSIEWSNYFRTFSYKLWIVIIILILTAPIILICMIVITGERNSAQLISECYFQMWGIICQQGLVEFPQRASLRFAYISLFISALVLSAAYSAALISFLTNMVHSLPFTTLEEFVKDGTYTLIVLKDSIEYDLFANSQEPVAKLAMPLMKNEDSLPPTVLEAFSQVCFEHKVALYISTKVKHFLESEIPCDVASIHTGHMDSISMMLTKKSQFLKLINHYILKFLGNGVIKRLNMSYRSKKYTKKVNINPIQIWSIIPILSFLEIGIVLSICILIAEKFYFSHRRKRYLKSKKKKILINSEIFSERKEVFNKDEIPKPMTIDDDDFETDPTFFPSTKTI